MGGCYSTDHTEQETNVELASRRRRARQVGQFRKNKQEDADNSDEHQWTKPIRAAESKIKEHCQSHCAKEAKRPFEAGFAIEICPCSKLYQEFADLKESCATVHALSMKVDKLAESSMTQAAPTAKQNTRKRSSETALHINGHIDEITKQLEAIRWQDSQKADLHPIRLELIKAYEEYVKALKTEAEQKWKRAMSIYYEDDMKQLRAVFGDKVPQSLLERIVKSGYCDKVHSHAIVDDSFTAEQLEEYLQELQSDGTDLALKS